MDTARKHNVHKNVWPSQTATRISTGFLGFLETKFKSNRSVLVKDTEESAHNIFERRT